MGILDDATREEMAMADQFIADIKDGTLHKKILPNTSCAFDDDAAYESFKAVSKSDEFDKTIKGYYDPKE